MGNYNRTKTVDVQLTIDTNAYTANDVVGGLITFVSGIMTGGTVRRLQIIDDDNEKAAFTLHLFDQKPTVIADDAAFAPAIADLKKRIGVVTIAAGDYTTVNGNAYADKHDINYDFDGEAANVSGVSTFGTLYGYLVATGTPTYTATTDLYLRLTLWVD